MVPDQLPASSKELSEDMRRERALKSVRNNLLEAVKRLNAFVEHKSHTEIIKRVHTAKTEIINDNDDPEIVTYYSLWTDFNDMRLTASGQLLRSDPYNEKYDDVRKYGADKSTIVSLYDLRNNRRTYKADHLLSLANQLDKFLRNPVESTAEES